VRDFVLAYLKDTTMHEVGHTVGLRHNFKGSSGIPFDRLNDTEYTREHGLTSSVMDYTSANINSDRENQGDHYSHVVGDYDVWAIQYGYTPLEMEEPGALHPWLAELASRSAEPGLAYGTDEDSASPFGWDPLTNYFDLSDDPIAYYEDRLALVAGLQDELVERTVSEGEDWSDLRAGVLTLMYEVYSGGAYVAKQVGGHEMSRAHRGDPGAPAPITVTSTTDQRRALAFIARILAGDEMVPAPESYPYLVNTFWAWGRGGRSGWGLAMDVHSAVRMRKMVIVANLFDVDRVVRIRDNAWAAGDGENPVTMAEVVDTVTAAIWGEDLAASAPADSFARGLQADYVEFLIFHLSSWYGRSPDLEVLALTTLLEIRDSAAAALEAGGLDRLVAAHYTAVEMKITTLLELYGLMSLSGF
ncbi:zinc-dependent metalloprotease, partial [bacterium]|nr:zinc-dependent metalloprotease [bacterium]